MSAVRYIAKRSLIPDHEFDTQYTLGIDLADAKRKSDVQKHVVRAASGRAETLNHYSDREWALTFRPVCGSGRDELLEFLRSTSGGESFDAWLYGDESEPVAMRRTDNGFKQQRNVEVGSREGELGSDEYYCDRTLNMARFIYTAKRSFLEDHLVDYQYSFEIDLSSAESSDEDEKTTERSNSGASEVILQRTDVTWSIEFAPVRGTQLLQLREFLDSTESGEPFKAWIYGDEVEPLLLRRLEDTHTETSFQRVGSASEDYFQATIKAIETTEEPGLVDPYIPDADPPEDPDPEGPISFSGAYTVSPGVSSTGPIPGGDGTGYYDQLVNGGFGCGAIDPDPAIIDNGIGTSIVVCVGFSGNGGGKFVVIMIGTLEQDDFAQVALGSPYSDLTFATADATFSTTNVGGNDLSIWKWASSDEYTNTSTDYVATFS